MKNIEIPHVNERGWRYRLFEILPGALTWSLLGLPLLLSIVSPRLTVALIIAYMLMWFTRSIGLSMRVIQGYRLMQRHQKLPWSQMLKDLAVGEVTSEHHRLPKWHAENIKRLHEAPTPVSVNDIYHAVIIATYNESRAVLEPTIQRLLASDYDMDKVILILAYEERGGPKVEEQAQQLIQEYGGQFHHAEAVKHNLLPGEVKGKGGNITCAGRKLKDYVEKAAINPLNVIVTTLDADNRPHQKYLSALSYVYAASPDPVHVSFQPISMYTSNIWDAPAPMRVIATGNSFWGLILSVRPHILRNFSAHSQSLKALFDTDFWSVRTIVEDGHHFWRTYFTYDGKHEVYPLYLPVYQDAVLSDTLFKTFKAQFYQLRRWAWGATDVAYLAEMGYFRRNKVPKRDLTLKFLRLLEAHVSWAIAPIIMAFSAFVPAVLNPQDFAAIQLPLIASRIQTVAAAGIFVTLFVSLKTLPPKPARYRKHRSIFIVLQWVFLPFTTIFYSSISALNAQTRLMLGRYVDEFDVTDKAVVLEDKRKVL